MPLLNKVARAGAVALLWFPQNGCEA